MYDKFEYGLFSSKEAKRLRELKEKNRSMGRANTKEVFERAETIEEAERLILGEGEDADGSRTQLFARFIEDECEICPRHGRNYRAVLRNLSAYRERVIEAAVSPTVLYHIACAPAETVETVVASFEAGNRLKVDEVKALLQTGEPATEDDGDPGGVKALRDHAAKHARTQADVVTGELLTILEAVVTALEPATDNKRVEKGKLAAQVVKLASLANRQLEELLGGIDADHFLKFGKVAIVHRKCASEAWREFHKLVYRLGGEGDWPKGTAFVPWLTDEVVPQLLWALDGGVPKKLKRHALETVEAVREAQAKRKPAKGKATIAQPATEPAMPIDIEPETADADSEAPVEKAKSAAPTRKPRTPRAKEDKAATARPKAKTEPAEAEPVAADGPSAPTKPIPTDASGSDLLAPEPAPARGQRKVRAPNRTAKERSEARSEPAEIISAASDDPNEPEIDSRSPIPLFLRRKGEQPSLL